MAVSLSVVSAAEQTLGNTQQFLSTVGQIGLGIPQGPPAQVVNLPGFQPQQSSQGGFFSSIGQAIGGGFGGLAYWLYKIGFRDITVYDSPQMNIIQEYYLSKTLPEAKICFYGDHDKSGWESSEIKILPYWCLDKTPKKSYDIAVSQDSLPEIPTIIAKYYLKKIIHTTKKYFYSINQEVQAPNYQSGIQEPVHKLVKDFEELKLLFRSPFWFRPGYAQEIYNII